MGLTFSINAICGFRIQIPTLACDRVPLLIESKTPLPAVRNISKLSPQAVFIRPKNSKRNQQWIALFEVVICCGFPTQLLFIGILAMLGIAATDTSGTLSIGYIFLLSISDTILLLFLIFYFLRQHQENPVEIFLGRRQFRGEFLFGLMLTPFILGLTLTGAALLHYLWPSLRNVPDNPFTALLTSPMNAALFTVVAVIAGGIREELQRAFILLRFDQHLGGAKVGLVIFSLVFGLGHALQGWDAAIITALLGALWGSIYLLRRSVISTIVSHTSFNIVEICLLLAGVSNSSS